MTPFVLLAVALGLAAAAGLTRPLWWPAAARPSVALAAALGVFVLGVAAAGYGAIGSPGRLAPATTEPQIAAMLDSALALANANQRRFDGEPSELIARALQLDPRHPRALAIAGAVAFDRQDYRSAVRHWERLAQVEPADSPIAPQIRQSIAQARQLAGMAP